MGLTFPEGFVKVNERDEMSRIFDALSRAGGETADIVRKVVGDAPPGSTGGDIDADGPVTTNGFQDAAEESPFTETFARVYGDESRGEQVAGPYVAMADHASEHQHHHESRAIYRSAGTAIEPGVASAIRTVSLHPHSPVLLFDDQHRKASEQYRMVRTRIVQHPRRPKVITITSGSPGDGKTFNAINLAGVLSLKDDSRVLLVDGDLRRSSVARSLGIDESPGLGEVLRGKASLRSALVRIEKFENLYVLPAGEPEDRPAELLDSPAWPALIDIFRRRFSYTIVDAPPVAAVADYDLIQEYCDGVILVVRQDHSNRGAFQKAMESVGPDKRLGVILNSSQDWWLAKTAGYYYYGNYDGYYYGKDSNRKKK